VHRTEYCWRLRDAALACRISLFDYSVTSNHVHLLAQARSPGDISRFMHKLQGQFAAHYNRRKHRSGAFWEERYRATMVESGEHLMNCLRYIDLNMVRAGVVEHPREWRWCGYQELVGGRERYRLLDLGRLQILLGIPDVGMLAQMHAARIVEAIEQKRLRREEIWTESIAVGSELFVRAVAERTKRRKRLRPEAGRDGTWFVRDPEEAYGWIRDGLGESNADGKFNRGFITSP
jgi:putative transposase